MHTTPTIPIKQNCLALITTAGLSEVCSCLCFYLPHPSFLHVHVRGSLSSISIRPAEVGEHADSSEGVINSLVRHHARTEERFGVHDVVERGRALLLVHDNTFLRLTVPYLQCVCNINFVLLRDPTLFNSNFITMITNPVLSTS